MYLLFTSNIRLNSIFEDYLDKPYPNWILRVKCFMKLSCKKGYKT